ncbi:hypothetical protein LCGC14_1720890 [marine sediment metagenome]|uniref:Uncharacterized protein n=1 Tax=marine sediment metagenome TaxID=412755 RepID=A0A0F9JSV4_9ZZZZ
MKHAHRYRPMKDSTTNAANCQHHYCQYQGRNGVRHERCCRCGNVVGRGMSYGGPSWKNKPWLKKEGTDDLHTPL